MRTLQLIIYLSFLWFPLNARQDSTLWKTNVELGLRSYLMGTSYPGGDFKNDHAWGQMARVSLSSNLPHGFKVNAEYLGFLRLLSSDLTALDRRVPNLNRYEVGLFDVNHLDRRIFGKTGNLNLAFEMEKFQAKLGRMEINTPFINPQDGRLSPTYVEGLQLHFQLHPQIEMQSNLFWAVSPRSTGGWFGLGESIGMYPVARDVAGSPSAYFNNTHVDFAHVLNANFALKDHGKLQLNHTLVDNIYSAFLAQWDQHWNIPETDLKGITGLQATFQHGLGNGGNEEIDLRYRNPEDYHLILSGRIGLQSKRNLWYLNYTNMQGKGRYLSPREWGRDPFYTFIPRERNEGLGQVDALSTYFQHSFIPHPIQAYSFVGIYFLPDAADARRNKYAVPSYAQLNLGMRYNLDALVRGLHLHLIMMGKVALDQQELKPAWVYNKVNLIHFNTILNYTLPWQHGKF
ncbi:outer membrane porin, OprD family [Cyclobacterium lianum]|uniref:Outer membrane porin, OprD family n=1 Tax=Cyclobacterium lianum TaxID=388280 RepID=A0A1M7QT24_9BACT|nr:OprD family outer membrane porin [Cyclobacterium lianum]SHN34872.1 outer membrane porin, OprD family [Cyclobacterium lianum]